MMLRKFWHAVLIWFGRPLEQPKPDCSSPPLDEGPVVVSRSGDKILIGDETGGRYKFKRDILDRLEDTFDILRRLRKSYPDAYNLLSRVGCPIQSPEVLVDVKESLPSRWRENAPLFGASTLIGDFLKDGDYEVLPKLSCFTKLDHVPPECEATSGTVFEFVQVWFSCKRDEKAKWLRNGLPMRCFISVENGIPRVLKQRMKRIITAERAKNKHGFKRHGEKARISTTVYDFPYWVKDTHRRDKTGEKRIIEWSFCACAKANENITSDIQVRCSKGSLTALFAVDLLQIPKFFDDREKVLNEKGKPLKIFHIVRAHARLNGYVKSHFRGVRRFTWKGYEVLITVPGLHHVDIAAPVPFGAELHDPDMPVPAGTIGTKRIGEIIRRDIEGQSVH